MRDPDVASLRYRLVPDQNMSFDRPPAIGHETDTFRARLADQTLGEKVTGKR